MIPEPQQVTAPVAATLTAALDAAPAVSAARVKYEAALGAYYDARHAVTEAEKPLHEMARPVPVTPAQLETLSNANRDLADATLALATALRKVQAAADATAANILGGAR